MLIESSAVLESHLLEYFSFFAILLLNLKMKYCTSYSSASIFILLESHSLQVSILHLNL